MSPRAIARLAPVLAFASVALHAGAANEGPGTRAVRRANQTVSALLHRRAPEGSPKEKKLAAQTAAAVRDFLDVEELGQRALRDHWSALKRGERAQFIRLLKEIVVQSYIRGMRARLDYQVAYTGEKRDGDHIDVSTEIHTTRHGRPHRIRIDYLLRHDRRRWRAFDIVTDGVGLVENYRGQFNRIIAREGFHGLLDKMRLKRQELAGNK